MTWNCELKIYTGTGASYENPESGDATNWNLLYTDSYDSTGVDYQLSANRIPVPTSGTNYSYERWLRLKFSGTFNLVTNIKFWRYSGTLSDPAIDLLAGVTATASTPTNAQSTIATTTLANWDSETEALDCTPTGGITTTGYTKYCVVQLKVPSTVVVPGDIGVQTIRWKFDVS